MLFLYSQHIGKLPRSLHVFQERWRQCFPQIYDTKCIGTALGLFAKTNLKHMHQQLTQNKKYSQIEFEFDSNFTKYCSEVSLHEAGYDSYLTGVCFISMLKFIEC